MDCRNSWLDFFWLFLPGWARTEWIGATEGEAAIAGNDETGEKWGRDEEDDEDDDEDDDKDDKDDDKDDDEGEDAEAIASEFEDGDDEDEDLFDR